MSGLLRIILIDTHLPGRVELKVNGHTNICGTNASGKTTLQRLIPVFYGEAPSRVVPATRDSFQAWYLPRESSFIIYEYQRQDDNTCMAVLTSSSSGVVFRFIDKAFELDDFVRTDLTGEAQSIGINEIVRNMKRNGVVTSNKLNNKEFRAVIQNDRSLMGASGDKRDLIANARFFSLCEASANLRHIEKLIKAVHSKEGKMETIKAMIAAILEEDGVRTPASRISRAKVEEWIKECQLIQEFDALRPEYQKLESCHARLQQTESRLGDLAHQLSVDISLISESNLEQEKRLNELKQQLTDTRQSWEQDRDTLSEALSVAKGEMHASEQRLDMIEQEFDDWQDKDIETHLTNQSHVPQWQSELTACEDTYKLLTEQHQDIEAAYHKQLAELSQRHNKDLEKTNGLLVEANGSLSQKQLQGQQAGQSLAEQHRQQRQDLVADFERQLSALALSIGNAETEIRLAGSTSEEQQALALLEAAIDEAVIQEDVSREQVQRQQQQLDVAKQQQQQMDAKLQQQRNLVAKAQEKVDAAEKLLYPGQGTLLEFLRKEDKDWQDKLGLVINPQLLTRTDLKPGLQEDGDSNTCFGVQLDVSVLEQPDYLLSEAELQQQLSECQDELSQALATQDEIESSLAQLNDNVRVLQQKMTELTSACGMHAQSRQRVQEEKKQLLEEQRQALRLRKQDSQKQLQALQAQQAKLNEAKQEAESSLQSQQQEEKLEHEMHWQQVTGDLQSQIDALLEQLQQSKQAEKDSRRASKKWYESELANRDVDLKDIAKLKDNIQQLQQDIEVTQQHRDAVADYKRWYDLVFTQQKSQYQTQLSEAKTAHAQAQRQLDEKRQGFKQQEQRLRSELTDCERLLREQQELGRAIYAVSQQLLRMALPDSQMGIEQGNAQQRLNDARELVDTQRKLVEDIDHHIRYFDNAIGQKAGTSLSDVWERARNECLRESDNGALQLNTRDMVTHLDQLLNVIVPQKLEGLRTNGRIFGNDLSQYYLILADIDKRIAQQSRRISKEVDEELFLDGVSDSSVKIRSRISELEFWPELKGFSQKHQQWLELDGDSLPDEDYADSILRVLEILGRAALQGGISQLLDIELHLREGNSDLVIRTDKQLNESSSHGMAYLILCKFLLAFTRLLRGESGAIVHWPIDEIGTLATANVKKIFDACLNNQITVVGAFPNPESDVLNLFENRYLIDKQTRKLQTVQPKVNPISSRIQARIKQESVA